jgi:hypothetical protein
MQFMTTSNDITETRHVLLLTAADCHPCEHGKDVLSRLGRDIPLAVEEVTLESHRGQELARQFGVLFPPGLFLDGSFVGFGRVSERKLRKLLEQRPAGAVSLASRGS